MKVVFWIGLVVLILGFASLLVPIPQRQREGVNIGGVSLGVETRTEEKVSPALSAVMIIGGLIAIIAGNRKAS